MARVSTIPAGVPFVDALASGLLAETEGDALALADMLVLLPNRRACRSLRDAFWRQARGAALALPTIQPIGDLEPDDLLPDPAGEADLPPAIGTLRRRLMLTRLLVARGWSPDLAGRLADDLAGLLDELQTERIALAALEDLVPAHLAAHWQQSLEILRIVSRYWPVIVAEEQSLDPAERRHLVLTGIAGRWAVDRPGRRIVAAGSTGSIPGTRALLQVVAGLPRGEVVLPGLERELDDASWQALDPQHPQYGLARLLEALGVGRCAVTLWPGAVATGDSGEKGGRGQGGARRKLLRDVMQPSAVIGAWQDLPPPPPAALTGLTIAEHPDLPSEATAIALRLRAALETPARTAALVTPDRPLARRVAIELRRFGIEIDDSAGLPLDQTAPGSLLLLAARLLAEGVRPVALLSVLKHPLTRTGLAPGVVRQRARALERLCLRGPAIVGGFRHILAELNSLCRQAGAEDGRRWDELAELRDWLESLARLAGPFAELMAARETLLGGLIEAHLRFAEGLAEVDGSGGALWAREAGETAAALFRELLEAAGPADRILPVAYPGMLRALMAGRPMRPRRPGHPRLFLWGQLEARLQQADLMILAGLNEGVWPRAAEPGPWLNPTMREQLGLPSLERRIGQAAHDFVQAAAGPEVVLSRAEKDLDGNPTVPSRWLVRLRTLLAASGSERAVAADPCWQRWVERLDLPDGAARPEAQPRPAPPVGVRPRRLSLSDVGLWMSNPYGLYAKRILGLAPLEPLEADPGGAERGQIIHGILEAFVRAYPDELPDGALRRLEDFGIQAFAGLRHRPQVRAIWWPRFLEAAGWVVERERAARPDLQALLPEVRGVLEIEAPAGPVRITARADRLERRRDGGVNVVDYKTGALPGRRDLETGRTPQLPLEGVMVTEGAFPALGASPLAELHFWKVSGDESGGEFKPYPAEIADGALDGLKRLILHFDHPDTPYPASYRPPTASRQDYDHLARLGEWPS